MKRERKQYSVVWLRGMTEDDEAEREGQPKSPRRRSFWSIGKAREWLLILQGKQEEASGLDPDQPPWSSRCGPDQFCGGCATNREHWETVAEKLPPLLFARIEVRRVGPWEPVREERSGGTA